MGPDDKAEDCGFESRRRCSFFFFFFSFTLVLNMLHIVFFLEVVLLKKLQFNKKKIKKMSKKGWDNHLGSTSSFFIVFHCWS